MPETSEELKPVAFAYSFELAHVRTPDGGYSHFGKPELSFDEPRVPAGAVRNLTPLYRHTTPTAADTPGHLANLLYYGNHCLDKGTELQKAVLWAASVLTAISADERIPPWIKQLCSASENTAAADTGLVERENTFTDGYAKGREYSEASEKRLGVMLEAAEQQLITAQETMARMRKALTAGEAFRLLFIADSVPPGLTLDVDPDELANAYDTFACAAQAALSEVTDGQ